MKPAPPVTSNLTERRLQGGLSRSQAVSGQVDLAVIPDHHPGSSGPPLRASDLDVPPEQRVLEPAGTDDPGAGHHHRVLDFGADDLAVVVNGRKGADEAVLDPCIRADDR